MLEYREAGPFDFLGLSKGLRSEDLVEYVLATGKRPNARDMFLAASPEGSITYAVVTPQGDLGAVFGSLPNTEPGEGSLWFLATDAIEAYSKSLLKTFPLYLDRISAPYLRVSAWMWEGNGIHRKWAAALGVVPTGRTMVINHNTFIEISR